MEQSELPPTKNVQSLMSETHETMNELWAGYDVNNVKTASEIIKQQREAAAAAHLELIRV